MCGRRKAEKTGIIYNSEMDFSLLQDIAKQIPEGVLIQFHWNGDPLLYSRLGEALDLFDMQIKCFDTNGKLLMQKYYEIVDKLDTITISTFENDPEWEEQYQILKQFIDKKGNKKPNVVIRCLGEIDPDRRKLYEETGCVIANRILHSPMGSFNYTKKTVIPEHGICLEMLFHPAININGDISICVRFDPDKIGVLGNIKENSLIEIWNGDKRREWLQYHIQNKRDKIPLCKKCEFYGIPRG
jgi:radical SAM protein with 4Fe4S-binding SPASM domain